MTTNENNSRLKSYDDAAQALGVCVATLGKLVRAGIGPTPTRIGRRVFFLDTEIESYVRRQTAQARPKISFLDCDLAAIVRAELEARAPNLPPELYQVTADVATMTRAWDATANTGRLNAALAESLASMTENLIRCLILLGGTATTEGTLAEAIALGALNTVRPTFSHLLAEEFR